MKIHGESIFDLRSRLIVENNRLKYRPNEMVELIGVSFIADQPSIFGRPDQSYIERELAWYLSGSTNVNDIPGGTPKIWRQVATPAGEVNSAYGFLMLSEENGYQFASVVAELERDPASRRACAIYTRPTMHDDAVEGGRSDFCCTNAVNYLLRDGFVHAVVQMRSQDTIFGYRNDQPWQRYMQECVAGALDAEVGELIFQVASLHVYPRHRALIPRVTYRSWHQVVERERGFARDRVCACGASAADWSLRPEHKVAGCTNWWVEDLDAYDALCDLCHKDRDRSRPNSPWLRHKKSGPRRNYPKGT